VTFKLEAAQDADFAAFDHTGKLSIPIDDDYKFTVNDYREKLYQQVVANKKDRSARMAAYFGINRAQ